MSKLNELLSFPGPFCLGNFPVNLMFKIILDQGLTLNAPLKNNYMTFSALISFNKFEQPLFLFNHSLNFLNVNLGKYPLNF